jgi:hypothetical protein
MMEFIISIPDSPPELILPGVNINGSGDSVAIPCRCWTMGTECYHTFPAFSLAKATPTISVFHGALM